MATCSTCGEVGGAGALFCTACGARLPEHGVGGPADPLVGRTLNGTYLVQHRIGCGGMGDVYRAIHVGLESPVALKVVRRELAANSAMVHRFQREARAASRLRHPNVVSVTDFGHAEDGTLFMVMEYVSGRSLARVIADDAPLPERRIVQIGAQILSALAEAHAHDVLHRDLKPENVMIEARRNAPEVVKVLDFGIAKVLASGEAASTLTQAGLVCGTPGYMSPEQLRGGEVDARSDLFSVGVVLYEMLTHRLPFDVHAPMEMLHRLLSEPITPPGERRGRPVSPALEMVVMRALATRPGDRPESAIGMRAELLAAVAPPEAERASRSRAGGSTGGAPAIATPAQATPAPRPSGSRVTAGQRTRTPSMPVTGWDPAVLERASRDLAPHLGPVARILVRRACARARDVAELYDLLAREIPGEGDRERFKRLAPRDAAR